MSKDNLLNVTTTSDLLTKTIYDINDPSKPPMCVQNRVLKGTKKNKKVLIPEEIQEPRTSIHLCSSKCSII